MAKPKLKDVEIIVEEGERFIVKPVWSDVDRPSGSVYSCGKNRKLAERLKAAMIDGAVFENVHHEVDIYGNSYVSAFVNIRMRCANADLKRLGF